MSDDMLDPKNDGDDVEAGGDPVADESLDDEELADEAVDGAMDDDMDDDEGP